jgi:hypothetical protein
MHGVNDGQWIMTMTCERGDRRRTRWCLRAACDARRRIADAPSDSIPTCTGAGVDGDSGTADCGQPSASLLLPVVRRAARPELRCLCLQDLPSLPPGIHLSLSLSSSLCDLVPTRTRRDSTCAGAGCPEAPAHLVALKRSSRFRRFSSSCMARTSALERLA